MTEITKQRFKQEKLLVDGVKFKKQKSKENEQPVPKEAVISEATKGNLAKVFKKKLDGVAHKNSVDEDGNKKAVTPAEWRVAAANYGTGMYKLEDIAETLGVSIVTASQKFKEMGIKKGAYEEDVKKELRNSVIKSHFISTEENNEIFTETQRDELKKTKFISDYVMKTFADNAKAGKSVAEIEKDVKVCKDLMSISSMRIDTVKKILNREGKDNNFDNSIDVTPPLNIRIMTAEEAEEIANRANSEDFAMGGIPEIQLNTDQDIIEEYDDLEQDG